jgi:hypothetical protein
LKFFISILFGIYDLQNEFPYFFDAFAVLYIGSFFIALFYFSEQIDKFFNYIKNNFLITPGHKISFIMAMIFFLIVLFILNEQPLHIDDYFWSVFRNRRHLFYLDKYSPTHPNGFLISLCLCIFFLINSICYEKILGRILMWIFSSSGRR